MTPKLDSKLETLFRLTPPQKTALTKLGLVTAADLLFYFPNRYETPGAIRTIAEISEGEEVMIYGQVKKTKISKAWRTKIPMSEAMIEDATGRIKAVWFHQAYMAKKIPEGGWGSFRGKVTKRKEELYLANPEVREASPNMAYDRSLFSSPDASSPLNLIAVYPETRGLSSGWFQYHIDRLLRLGLAGSTIDPLPPVILNRYHLPTLETALIWIHAPQKEEHRRSAEKRFAFEEIFYIQLERLHAKTEYQRNPSFKIKVKPEELKKFTDRFSFTFTAAQTKAIKQVLTDFDSPKPMTRLLEGDVGSGKTAVAASTAFGIVTAGGQVAYLAPTEILARQHFESFIEYFSHLNISIGLLTGTECRKFPSKAERSGHAHVSRPQLLRWVTDGQISILIGTHALIQKAVKFKNLAYAIIDEQHRFGVNQRSKMTRKDSGHDRVPHLLSMTATPIPRTLALTIYGDLDLTLLDQMPAGRKPVITEIVSPDKREEVYEKIRTELAAGRQIYVICPRIDEPDPEKALALYTKSAKAETIRLGEKIFPKQMVGLVHSKLPPKEKEQMMADFAAGEIDILVATSVVEVGVNVPNATSIIIEGAERFGLAQLHQLRGRVLRSNHQAYCYLFTETKSAKSLDRLKALKTAKNGFELAELDLALRGSGTLSAGKQWGISDLGMEAIRNIKMVEAARTEAQALLKTDFDLKKYPLIVKKLASRKTEIHFE